jgi:hypothetical protein
VILLCVLMLLACGAIPLFMLVRSWRIQQDIRRRFFKDECRGEDLARVTSALARINVGPQDCTFGLERAFKILFRGQQLLVVLGPVGGSAPHSKFGTARTSSKALYALADGAAQMRWMRENSDVFSPACPDPFVPIFWVNFSVLKANLAIQSTTAPPRC